MRAWLDSKSITCGDPGTLAGLPAAAHLDCGDLRGDMGDCARAAAGGAACAQALQRKPVLPLRHLLVSYQDYHMLCFAR